jgi:D-aminoacyl-tRNA deacylase
MQGMRALLQRVSRASVTVNGETVGAIDAGLLALIGVTHDDSAHDIEWLTKKILNLRVFDDDAGVMNKSVLDVNGGVLAVSQFTLYAATAKGNRPSYTDAAKAEVSKPLFEQCVSALSSALGKPVPTGVFGADMHVSLVNHGPVTIWLDSKSKS